jgi:hypothetical protein
MSCHTTVSDWTTIIRTDLPQLSKPQATVLAVWLRRQEQRVRPQLRECCDLTLTPAGTFSQMDSEVVY